MPESLLRTAPQGIIPNPVPLSLHGLLSAFAHSTLLLFFLSHFLQKKQKRRLHSNRHHRAALAPEKKQLKAIIHDM